MRNLWNKHKKELLLIVLYFAVATAVYVCWFNSLWHLWYVDFITVVVILAISVTIGYFYIVSLDKAEAKKEAEVKETEAKTETKEE